MEEKEMKESEMKEVNLTEAETEEIPVITEQEVAPAPIETPETSEEIQQATVISDEEVKESVQQLDERFAVAKEAKMCKSLVKLVPMRLTQYAFEMYDALLGNPEVVQMLDERHELFDDYSVQEHISGLLADENNKCFNILYNGNIVGNCILKYKPVSACCELQYYISSYVWNRGIGKAVVKIALAYAFVTLGCNQVHAYAIEPNRASRRCLEAAGMKLQGVLREKEWVNGKFENVCYFDILKKEYDAQDNSDINVLKMEVGLSEK